ncbi:MAG TPA: hypothetical protein VEC57_05190 [Candidatus Limnocylindrales bacterium]|nr:hypothetical protein [Candidatus Limnocylindrales bacterium]
MRHTRPPWLVLPLLVLIGAAPAPGAPEAFQEAVAADQPVLWFTLDETEGDAINHGSLGNRTQGFTRYFTGTLDEVVLYDRMLTAGRAGMSGGRAALELIVAPREAPRRGRAA